MKKTNPPNRQEVVYQGLLSMIEKVVCDAYGKENDFDDKQFLEDFSNEMELDIAVIMPKRNN